MGGLQLIYTIGIVVLTFAVMVPVPGSLGRKHKKHSSEDRKEKARELCNHVSHKHVTRCRKIIKSQYSRFEDTNDDKGVAYAVVDLAREKANKIQNQLKGLQSETTNEDLKSKYKWCSTYYKKVVGELDQARSNLDSKDFKDVRAQAEDAFNAYTKCKGKFGRNSFDPAHIRNKNKDFEVHAELVKVAAKRLIDNNKDDDDDDS